MICRESCNFEREEWLKESWIDWLKGLKSKKAPKQMSNFWHFLEYPFLASVFVSLTAIGNILVLYTQTCGNPSACGYVIYAYCGTPILKCDEVVELVNFNLPFVT